MPQLKPKRKGARSKIYCAQFKCLILKLEQRLGAGRFPEENTLTSIDLELYANTNISFHVSLFMLI